MPERLTVVSDGDVVKCCRVFGAHDREALGVLGQNFVPFEGVGAGSGEVQDGEAMSRSGGVISVSMNVTGWRYV